MKKYVNTLDDILEKYGIKNKSKILTKDQSSNAFYEIDMVYGWNYLSKIVFVYILLY